MLGPWALRVERCTRREGLSERDTGALEGAAGSDTADVEAVAAADSDDDSSESAKEVEDPKSGGKGKKKAKEANKKSKQVEGKFVLIRRMINGSHDIDDPKMVDLHRVLTWNVNMFSILQYLPSFVQFVLE